MTEQSPTPEQIQAAQEQHARNEALLLQVIQGATLSERSQAARELGILAPANVQPPQTRVVLRMVRDAEGKFWGAIEGANGAITQVIQPDGNAIIEIMKAAAVLVTNPLMTDDEHAAFLKAQD
jgi:hypothetical protein